MFKTIKSQLYAITLSFSVVSLFLLFIASYHHKKREFILNTNFKLKEIQKLLIQDKVYFNSFLLNESTSPKFYKKRQSDYYIKHIYAYESLKKQIHKLLKESSQVSRLDSFSVKLDSIHQDFIKLIYLQLERGFQDYGIEGEMRDKIHYIEREGTIDLSTVLMLRRHEKDYIIRHQQQYIEKHQKLMNKVLTDFENVNPVIYLSLINYARYFKKLVELDRQIGRMGNKGVEPELNNIFKSAERIISEEIDFNNRHMKRLLTEYSYSYWTAVFLFFSILIFISIYISRRASMQLHNLGEAINAFVKSGFKKIPRVPYKKDHNEIHLLIQNFTILQNEIIDYIHSFEQKVEEQTIELKKQKKEILEQNTEILAQRDKMQEQVELISSQHKQLEIYNTRLTDSINYAQHIQQALLPSKELFEEVFPQNFLYFLPKDILSGDFYWMNCNKAKDTVYLAVADCTGHGVPGAMLSMLGISFLNEIFSSYKQTSPSNMLNQLRKNFLVTMSNNSTKKSLNDGMDIGLAEIDFEQNKLFFAGANRDIYIVRESELIILKGDNMPIGKYVLNTPFSQKEFKLLPGDCIYMFTDGYNDQFGGVKNRKFKRKNFKKLLLAVQTLSFEEQLKMIDMMHKQWKQDKFQVDDILIIGFQYKLPENTFSKNQTQEKNIHTFG